MKRQLGHPSVVNEPSKCNFTCTNLIHVLLLLQIVVIPSWFCEVSICVVSLCLCVLYYNGWWCRSLDPKGLGQILFDLKGLSRTSLL